MLFVCSFRLKGFLLSFSFSLNFFFLLERGWREGEGESGGQSRGPTSCWAQGSGSGRRRAWLRPPGLAALGDGPWSPALASRPGLLPLPSPSPAHSLPREQLRQDLRRPGDSRPPPSLPRLPAHTALLGLFVFFFSIFFFPLSLSLFLLLFFFPPFFFPSASHSIRRAQEVRLARRPPPPEPARCRSRRGRTMRWDRAAQPPAPGTAGPGPRGGLRREASPPPRGAAAAGAGRGRQVQ